MCRANLHYPSLKKPHRAAEAKGILSHPSRFLPKSRRHVSFARDSSSPNVQVKINIIPAKTDEDKKEMFYNYREQVIMRHRALKVARQGEDEVDSLALRREPDLQVGNDYYTPVVLGAYRACRHKEDSESMKEGDIEHIAHVSFARRGLERYCFPATALSEIASVRQYATKTVTSLHGKIRESRGHVSNEMHDYIARVYKRCSKQSQRFAALLGQVDAIAAKYDGEDEESKEETDSQQAANYERLFNEVRLPEIAAKFETSRCGSSSLAKPDCHEESKCDSNPSRPNVHHFEHLIDQILLD